MRATMSRFHAFGYLIAGLACALTIFALPANAHELRPAIATAELEGRSMTVSVTLNLEAYLAGIGPDHENTDTSAAAPEYNRLRRAAPAQIADALSRSRIADDIHVTADGSRVPLALLGSDVPEVGDTSVPRIATVILNATLPQGTQTLAWQAAPNLGDTVFRVQQTGAPTAFHAAYIAAGATGAPVSIQGSAADPWASLFDYIVIGFDHIVPKGLDHILFIIGLFLLCARLRPLLWQVTGFTLAHSVTLALGVLGWVSVPPEIVEPLIAASIVFIAIENLFTDRLQRWRPMVIFGFGLLHGLGFAGVLSEVGLPEGALVPALVGFNLGVEVGQLAVLAACFLVVGLWFRHRHWYRPFVTMPASVLVAAVAAFWFAERIA